MADQDLLKTIAIVACPVMLSAIGWFVRGMVKSSQEMTKELQITIHQFDIVLALVKKDIEVITKELTQMVIEFKNVKSMHEDVVILKRDQQTIWCKIDELRVGK